MYRLWNLVFFLVNCYFEDLLLKAKVPKKCNLEVFVCIFAAFNSNNGNGLVFASILTPHSKLKHSLMLFPTFLISCHSKIIPFWPKQIFINVRRRILWGYLLCFPYQKLQLAYCSVTIIGNKLTIFYLFPVLSFLFL